MIAHSDAAPSVNGHRPGGLTRLLDLLSSIWFGVSLLILIFLYSSIGSAVPLIRQGALADWTGLEFLRFDKTEMEWFSWWPLTLMLGLFCLSITLVTLRKIPLTIVNAGVWAIHTGIVMLAISSALYFGTKVEGDAVIFQSKAMIFVPGMPEPVPLIVRPEASTDVFAGNRMYRVTVARMDPSYELLSGVDKGKKTQSIWFNINTGERNFTRVVLVGYPEYTEDVITGGAGGPQRAVKLTGERLIDKDLQIELAYDPARYFYHSHVMPVRSTGALYARFQPNETWRQIRFDRLPHYFEHLAHRGELWPENLPKTKASLELTPSEVIDDSENTLKGLDIRITDYLPYAMLDPRWVDAGENAPPNPYIRFRFGGAGSDEPIELLSQDPRERRRPISGDFAAEFVWVNSAAERQAAIAQPNPRLVVAVPSKQIEKTLKLADVQGRGPVPIEGTDYKIEVDGITPGDQLGLGSMTLASIGISKAAEPRYTRIVVSGDKGQSMDRDPQGEMRTEPLDKDLQIKFLDPARSGLLLVAGPDSPSVDLVLSMASGVYLHERASLGQKVSLAPMVTVQVEDVLERARQEVKPAIVSPQRRQGQQGKLMSLVRVEVNDGKSIQSTWLPYCQYAFDNVQWAQPGRFRWLPRTIQLADGRRLSLMYSQWRDLLPAPLALDRFVLETHTGGDRPADYISKIRVWKNGKWTPENGAITVKSNYPAQLGDKWFFQAQWDPEAQAHTVLGVGNRNGVHAMLTGVCISIAGMIYAFYFKPSIIRRRKEAALAKAAASGKLKTRSEKPEVAHV